MYTWYGGQVDELRSTCISAAPIKRTKEKFSRNSLKVKFELVQISAEKEKILQK